MKLSEQRNLTKKQILQEMASRMSASMRAEVRNLIDELDSRWSVSMVQPLTVLPYEM